MSWAEGAPALHGFRPHDGAVATGRDSLALTTWEQGDQRNTRIQPTNPEARNDTSLSCLCSVHGHMLAATPWTRWQTIQCSHLPSGCLSNSPSVALGSMWVHAGVRIGADDWQGQREKGTSKRQTQDGTAVQPDVAFSTKGTCRAWHDHAACPSHMQCRPASR